MVKFSKEFDEVLSLIQDIFPDHARRSELLTPFTKQPTWPIESLNRILEILRKYKQIIDDKKKPVIGDETGVKRLKELIENNLKEGIKANIAPIETEIEEIRKRCFEELSEAIKKYGLSAYEHGRGIEVISEQLLKEIHIINAELQKLKRHRVELIKELNSINNELRVQDKKRIELHKVIKRETDAKRKNELKTAVEECGHIIGIYLGKKKATKTEMDETMKKTKELKARKEKIKEELDKLY